MTEKITTRFFDAIHALPGDTPGEKFHYLSTLAREVSKNGDSMEDLIESRRLPDKMLPLFQLELARITNNSRIIAESLKSEDSLVINKALRIAKFFQAEDETIVNPEYFRENLLPYVSINTRQKIIKRLGIHLPPEKSQLAAKMFEMFNRMYGLEQAFPLLIACDGDYIHDFAVRENLLVPPKIMKMLYRKNSEASTRYLKSIAKDEISRKDYISNYKNYITRLIKTDAQTFAEIFEPCADHIDDYPPMSKKLAKIFMKNAKQYLIENPDIYVDRIPLHIIDTSTTKIIFPKILPDDIQDFSTKHELRYLKNLPDKDKFAFVINTFQETYGSSIFDDTSRIIPELMLSLSVEQRNSQARLILERESNQDTAENKNYKTVWRCYLPTNEIIPTIKAEISKCSMMGNRANLLTQITWCCRVNQDSAALLEFLKYYNTRHKNEPSKLLMSFIGDFINIYDLHALSHSHYEILEEIVRRAYDKQYLKQGRTACKLLEAMIHQELELNLSIDETLKLFIEFRSKIDSCWNMLIEFPEYEELCLRKSIDLAINECTNVSSRHLWFNDTYKILHDALLSIREYRERHKKDTELSKIIRDMGYPKLLELSLRSVSSDSRRRGNWERIMFECSVDAYKIQYKKFPPEDTVANLPGPREGKALSLLKKDPHKIKKHSDRYLKQCKSERGKRVQRFVKHVKWHKGIALNWLEICEREVENDNDPNALFILGLFLDGESFPKIVPRVDSLAASIPGLMKLVDPPPRLTTIGQLCEGDHMRKALDAVTNICRRTSVDKVVLFLRSLIRQKLTIKKQGLRLLYSISSVDDNSKMLSQQWASNAHHAVRAVLLKEMHHLFLDNPLDCTWNVFRDCVLDLGLAEEAYLPQLLNLRNVPGKYLPEYITLLLKTINNLSELGLAPDKAVKSLIKVIDRIIIVPSVSECFVIDLIKEFLFYPNPLVIGSTIDFILSSYLSNLDKLEFRLKLLSQLLIETIETRWDVPHPTVSCFYPVNHAIHFLFETVLSDRWIDDRAIDTFYRVFQATMDPHVDAWLYLLIAFRKEKSRSASDEDFGQRIGRVLPDLVNTYSEFLVSLMAYTLSSQFGDNLTQDFINGLLLPDNIQAYEMAAILVHSNYVVLCDDDRHRILSVILEKSKHPALTGYIRDRLNSMKPVATQDYFDLGKFK